MFGAILRALGLRRPDVEFLVVRSSAWPKCRAAWLKDHPTCAVCGTRNDVEVHHIVPVSWDAAKELDTTNLITLCPVHHLWVGHLGDWKSRNPTVQKDAADWADKIRTRTYPHPTKKPE